MFTNLQQRVAVPVAFAIAAILPAISQADVPQVDPFGVPAVVICDAPAGGPQIFAVHMDKIIFRITDQLIAAAPADQAALNAIPRDSRLDIKVLDHPRTVADLKAKVLTFLRAAVTPMNRDSILIDDVDYAVVCTRVPNAAAGGG